MKVIIDGNLIDLEMITFISKPVQFTTNHNNWYDGTKFSIHLVGKESITISRDLYTISREQHKGPYTEGQLEADTRDTVTRAYNKLIKLWAPNTTKFEEIKLE